VCSRAEGIDTDAMPLGRLTKEDIETAKQIVCDIRKIYLKIHPVRLLAHTPVVFPIGCSHACAHVV
jgi:hypothetical protein